MKKIFLLVLTIMLLSSCWSDDINDETSDVNVEKCWIGADTSKCLDSDNGEDISNLDSTPSIKPKIINRVEKKDDILSWIEDELNKEKEDEEKETILQENAIKNIVSAYFSAINSDKDIIKYLDINAILKIKKNTSIVYNSLNSSEKADFFKELQDYWYNEKSFDPSNWKHINKYINFIVKSWFKKLWNIWEVEYNFFRLEEDFNIANVTLNYDWNKEKKINIVLTKANKINISN